MHSIKLEVNILNRPAKRRKNSQIKGIIYPIDDIEEYKKSLGLTMLDILEKKLGSKVLAASMEKLKENC